MKALRGIIGFALAAIFALTFWGTFVDSYGIIGGWIVALAIIGPLWFLNHYIGLIPQDPKASFVDMGLGIGIGGIVRDFFLNDGLNSVVSSLPTILLVIVGASIGGFVAAKVQQSLDAEESN